MSPEQQQQCATSRMMTAKQGRANGTIASL
jgi:hypothetical protein